MSFLGNSCGLIDDAAGEDASGRATRKRNRVREDDDESEGESVGESEHEYEDDAGASGGDDLDDADLRLCYEFEHDYFYSRRQIADKKISGCFSWAAAMYEVADDFNVVDGTMDNPGDLSMAALSDILVYRIRDLDAVYNRLVRRDLIGVTIGGDGHTVLIRGVEHAISQAIVLDSSFFNTCKLKAHMAYGLVRMGFQRSCFAVDNISPICEDSPVLVYDDWKITKTDEKLSSYKVILLHTLDHIQECQLRRYGDALWCRRSVLDEDGHKVYLPAWCRHMSIEEFVYKLYAEQQSHQLWSMFNDSGSIGRDVVTYLKKCVDVRMPDLKFDRLSMAFKNGVYMLKTNEFIPMADLQTHPVCLAHFDHVYEFGGVPEYCPSQVDDYMRDIDTSAFDGILLYQLPEDMSDDDKIEVLRWIYAFLGRLLYDNGTDHHEKLLFFKGVGGSGKSTIAHILQSIYPPEVVSVMGANMERTFGMSQYANKCLVVATEIREKNDFETADILKWVSNEKINMAQKGKDILVEEMKAGLLWCGNAQPTETDSHGALLRRLFKVTMRHRVEHVNTHLNREVLGNMGPVVTKFNRAYRDLLLTRYAKVDIWGNESDGTPIVPEYFHVERKQMWAEMNPLVAFLQEGEYTVRHEKVHCKYSHFTRDFKEYCESMGLQYRKPDDEGTKHVFNEHHLKIVRWNERSYPVGGGITCIDNWVVGLCKGDAESIAPEFLARNIPSNASDASDPQTPPATSLRAPAVPANAPTRQTRTTTDSSGSSGGSASSDRPQGRRGGNPDKQPCDGHEDCEGQEEEYDSDSF